jgi:membrane protease YdiL (CAAX protease family)
VVRTSDEATPFAALDPAVFAPIAEGPGDKPPVVQINPNDPPWGIPAAMLTWIASVALIVVLQVIAIIPYLLLRHPGSNPDALKSMTSDKTAVFLMIIAVVPAHLLTLAIIWAVVTRMGERPFWSTLGWTWGERFRVWPSAGLAIAMLIVGWLIIKRFGGEETQLDQIIASSAAARYATAILATVTAPLVEEIIYRGLLYAALQRAIGAAGAVVIVLALFTAVHVPQYWPNIGVILTIGLLSITLTLLRALTGRLLPCYVVHLVFNGIQSLFIVLDPYIQQLGPHSGEQKAAVLHLVTKLFG